MAHICPHHFRDLGVSTGHPWALNVVTFIAQMAQFGEEYRVVEWKGQKCENKIHVRANSISIKKLDRVGLLITDPPPTSSTNFSNFFLRQLLLLFLFLFFF